jgi:hypothetical protein
VDASTVQAFERKNRVTQLRHHIAIESKWSETQVSDQLRENNKEK